MRSGAARPGVLQPEPRGRPDVAFFLPSLVGGGAQRVILTIASGLSELGWHVDLVFPREFGDLTHHVPANLRKIELRRDGVFRSIPALTRYLWRNRPAVLVSSIVHANLAAVAVGRLVGVPVVIRESTTPEASGSSTLIGGLADLIARHSYGHADAVIAPTHAIAERLFERRNVTRTRIRIIGNPLDIKGLDEKAKQIVGHPWFAPGNPPVILTAGRLAPVKDIPTLLRAFRRVRSRTESRLVILGEGIERDNLIALAQELGISGCVAFPGYVHNAPAYIRRASVYVLSSIREGLPNALLEALSLGVPVVATDCPSGPAEILENGRYGRLVAVGDDVAMADAILESLGGRRPGPADHIRRAYSRSVIVRQYAKQLECVASLAAPRPPRAWHEGGPDRR